ncbi:DNA-deoxyinosine glycosylase [Pseudoxanthomonas sp. PXM03]|uniref:DNA-deoxyinosine glycosylase n=1 Tax=Pseudoxanthomonas sp. PXM03 TaxID=2769284 RepID=UPI001786A922|nr:DNA-deoxyinosine glycosylase [Pseudoxanthomonas sp. PXM03]
MAGLLTGLPPSVGAGCRVLVLGSMPGDASLQAARYYAHPRNRFWPVMASICGFDPAAPYEHRLRSLHEAGVGLWDVIGQCERRGSLDAAIVRGSEVANPLEEMLVAHRSIVAIAFNGGKAAEAFRRYVQPQLPEACMPALFALPSTSPANAAIRHDALQQAWTAISPLLRMPA